MPPGPWGYGVAGDQVGVDRTEEAVKWLAVVAVDSEAIVVGVDAALPIEFLYSTFLAIVQMPLPFVTAKFPSYLSS